MPRSRSEEASLQTGVTIPTPPQNLAAEEDVIGAMMLDAGAIRAAAEVLEPEGERKFYRASHGLIYRACLAMSADADPVDATTLASFLDAHGKLESVGGVPRIQELASIVPSVGSTAFKARLVREAWAKRELANVLVDGVMKATNGVTSEQAMALVEQSLLEVRSRLETGGRSAVSTMLDLAMRMEDRMKNPPEKGRDIPAPFSFLSPLQQGRLYVLSGYTGDGKTVASVQYAKSAAKRRLKVGFFSIEMDEEQLYDRFIASFGIPLSEVESGQIKPHNMDTFKNAMKETVGWKVDVIDDRAANAAMVRRYQQIRRYDLIVIDHLHEISLGGRPSDRRQLLEDEVHRITTIARSESVPILLLAQLSRPAGSSNFPRPSMAMLRETARIEQAAAMVAFVWRQRDEQGQPEDEAEFIVAKNRFGPTGRRPLRFLGDTVRFVEVAV